MGIHRQNYRGGVCVVDAGNVFIYTVMGSFPSEVYLRAQIDKVARRKRSQDFELELELIQTQMAQKPMLRAEVGMRVRCANKASAE